MADEKKEKNSTKESVARWFTYSGIAVLVIAIFGSGIYYFQSNGSGLVGSATQGVQSWQNYDIPEMGSMVTIDLNGKPFQIKSGINSLIRVETPHGEIVTIDHTRQKWLGDPKDGIKINSLGSDINYLKIGPHREQDIGKKFRVLICEPISLCD